MDGTLGEAALVGFINLPHYFSLLLAQGGLAAIAFHLFVLLDALHPQPLDDTPNFFREKFLLALQNRCAHPPAYLCQCFIKLVWTLIAHIQPYRTPTQKTCHPLMQSHDREISWQRANQFLYQRLRDG